MAEYKLSRKAEADLRAIAAFTVDTFGITRARLYRDGLLDAFNRIAAHPEIGASCTSRRIRCATFNPPSA